jgi:mannose-6-phosphate isomerase
LAPGPICHRSAPGADDEVWSAAVQTTAVHRATAALLENPIREYAWGSRTAIPELLGVPPTGAPQAELWMGAHPADPSRVCDGQRDTLLARIEAAPQDELGADVVSRLGPRLPYLLKVIAAAAPLSLQAHPNAAQAAEGYAQENARDVPLSAPERNYRDANHKPELLCALTPFDALCGFRPATDTLRLLDELVRVATAAGEGTPAGRAAAALQPYVGALRARPNQHGLREVVTGLLTLPAHRRTPLVGAVAVACELAAAAGGEFTTELRTAVELAAAYPRDVGVVIALLLNLLRLRPGQGIFLPAGRLHAYLRGTGVEIMANSDNVLRGGLTPKHVDVAELLRVIDLTDSPVPAPEPRRVGPAEELYDTPAPEFRLSRLRVASTEPVTLDPVGPQILLTAEGELTIAGAGEPIRVGRGRSAWVPAGVPVTLTGTATAFRATTNLT